MLKIAICQLNFIVGDIDGNSQKILAHIKKAKKQNCDLVVFSELAICGYPPYDLLFEEYFVNKCIDAINNIAKESVGITAIVGGIDLNKGNGKSLFNTAFVLSDGKIAAKYYKALLPTYDVFDEARYFEPFYKPVIVNIKDKKVAVTICEDLWTAEIDKNPVPGKPYYRYDVIKENKILNPDLLVNIAASPYSYFQIEYRYEILKKAQKLLGCPIVYVNQIGCQTDIVFDGGSAYIDSNGIQIASFFGENLYFVNNNSINSFNLPQIGKIESIYHALILGIKDYMYKNNFKKVIIGLSGGIDSAVVTVLAADALGSENVHAFLMPSRYSSLHSVEDSLELCKINNISYDIVSIEPVFEKITEILFPLFNNKKWDTTEENIQARIRAIYLMAFSNKNGYVLLNTSNKSEMAVGYGTLYGDMCGAISVLGDVYKTQVYELAYFLNKEKKRIPENIILKAPSAELRPNQKDIDSLPEYSLLDKILFHIIEEQKYVSDIIQLGYNETVVKEVFRLVQSMDYKRFQAPPVIRISPKAFGMGRRFPLVKKWI